MFQAHNSFNFRQIIYLHDNKMETGLVGILTARHRIINQYACLAEATQKVRFAHCHPNSHQNYILH